MGGVPLLSRAVAGLISCGLTEFTIVDGYRGDMVRAAIASGFPGASFSFVRNEEWDTTGNAYSLHLAGLVRTGRNERRDDMFILDSDIAFDTAVIERLLEASGGNRLALRTRGDCGAEEMKVRLDAEGRVLDISKEIPPGDAAGESVGLEIFRAGSADRLFDILADRVRAGIGRTEFYEASFVELIRAGEPIHPVDLGELRCMEIDTPDDLDRADALFRPRP